MTCLRYLLVSISLALTTAQVTIDFSNFNIEDNNGPITGTTVAEAFEDAGMTWEDLEPITWDTSDIDYTGTLTPHPTPAPSPFIWVPNVGTDDPSVQCEWWKAGMTWDCVCDDINGKKNWSSGLGHRWKKTAWFFSSCSNLHRSCPDARRRKKFAVLCGEESIVTAGEFGTARDGFNNRNFNNWNAYSSGVAVFSIQENLVGHCGWNTVGVVGAEHGCTGHKKGDDKKATFWDDWMSQTGHFNLYGFPIHGEGKKKCDKDNCKCTCVAGANMLGTGQMKALLPYRGPGDDYNYIKPSTSKGGDHARMYATYCVGVCGVDCDSAGSRERIEAVQCYDNNSNKDCNRKSIGDESDTRRHGLNRVYASLISHDVCQAYIGSKSSYKYPEGRANGCGDEAAQNGACYAAEYSMRDYGGGCDTDAQFLDHGWCPDWLQGDN